MSHATEAVIDQLHHLTGRDHVILTGRAATGIEALLKVWGCADRVVLLPANTCYIVLWAVLAAGARPILVDVDIETGNISPKTLNAYTSEPPAAIIPCHLYGVPSPIGDITQWANTHNIRVLEDAALALGSIADRQPAGAWGEASILSFGLGKTVDVELGGAVLTDDAALAGELTQALRLVPLWNERLYMLTERWNRLYWALHQRESRTFIAHAYRLAYAHYATLIRYCLPDSYWDDLPPALDALPDNLAHRAELSALYDALLTSLPMTETLVRPRGAALWRYPLLVSPERRDELLRWLWTYQVDATRWYPSLQVMAAALAPDILQPPTPVADSIAARIINLPLDSFTTSDEVERIAVLINEFFNRHPHFY